MVYFLLFWEFFKVGLFSFGGGMATIPFLYEIADKYNWFNRSLLVDMIAVAEATPGPVGVNMATYAGYSAAGIIGSVIATFSLVAPSLMIVVIVAKILDKFKENRYVKAILSGIQPVVIGFIIAFFWDILKTSVFFDLSKLSNEMLSFNNVDIKFIISFVLLLILIKKNDINIIIYFLIAGLIGILAH